MKTVLLQDSEGLFIQVDRIDIDAFWELSNARAYHYSLDCVKRNFRNVWYVYANFEMDCEIILLFS